MADFEEVVNTRRSIREYDSKEVEDEKIDKILEDEELGLLVIRVNPRAKRLIFKAAMQAPGSRLKAEPWEFIVVKNRKTLKEIGEIKPRVSDAPVAIVLVANIERAFYKTMWQQDMSAAAENMLLEACNLGLGGLWNGVAPEEERMDKIAKLVGIDDENLKVFCLITLGYPKEGLKNEFMDKFDESRIHYEKY